MTLNTEEGLSKELESINFIDAQRNPNLLNPKQSFSSPSKSTTKRERKRNNGSVKPIVNSNKTTNTGTAAHPIPKGKSRSMRRREIRKKRSAEKLAEANAPQGGGTAVADNKDIVDKSKSVLLPANATTKSKPTINEVQAPLQPRAMMNGPVTNGKGKTDTNKEKEEEAKAPQTSMLSQNKSSEEAIAKKKEAQARRNIIKQNENAIAQAFSLLIMQINANFERDYGISWCQHLRKDAFPQDSDQKFRNRVTGRQVSMLWLTTRPSPELLRMRQKVIMDVQDHIDKRWPGCGLRVAPFGSTQTGLVEAASDIDLCLLDPSRPRGVGTPQTEVLSLPNPEGVQILRNERIIGIPGAPDYYNVTNVARALERYSFAFKAVQPIRHAKVPICKFVHSDSGLEGDLNVNDLFGLQNSDLITQYIDICPKIVAPFLFFIKKWAARRHINDPSGKSGIVSLNSYTLTVFGLQYLQIKGIVPNLQSRSLINTLGVPGEYLWQRPKGTASYRKANRDSILDDLDGEEIEVDPQIGGRRFDTTFCRLKTDWDFAMVQEDSANGTVGHCEPFSMDAAFLSEEENDCLLGSLLEGFFEWLANFDFEKCGMSLREGHPIRRHRHLSDSDKEKLEAFPYVKEWDASWKESAMLCQDPFILDRNTCGAVLETTRTIIANEASRAHKILIKANKSDKNGQSEQITPLLSDLMLDLEYEQLLEHHKQVLQGWDTERVAYVKQEAKARANNSQYKPIYNRIRDKRVREAQKQIKAKSVIITAT